MKLLFITRRFPPLIDGVGDYTFHLVSELAKRNYKILVICSENKEIAENVNPGLPFMVKPVIKEWTNSGVKILKEEIENFQPDWISLQYVPHGFHPKAIPLFFMPFVIWIKLKGYKLQTTFHEVAIGLIYPALKYWVVGILQRLIAWVMALCSRQIVTSTGLYVKMLRPFNKNITQIPIGSNFIETGDTVLSKSTEIIITSFTTRINDEALKAIKILADKGKKIKLIGLGLTEDSKIKALQTKAEELSIENMLTFTGKVSDSQLFGYLKNSDLYLQTEWTDNKGRGGVALKSGALAVALQAGMPVITIKGEMTDTAILKDGETVLYSKPDADSIASTIIAILENSALKAKLSQNARKFFEEKLSWTTIGLQYSALFDKQT